ncbi:homocysteine S-methyltransferase family protein [Microvirga rosea]|uniref:homocysteine S-methyltransferase family protein n=1 Tax=Microvirga rosea TaxID=2715425 RepID=UPI001D0B3C96|nr:homocysteine S-methyltransferase family protein [Microvirga rosea]MCB8821892.1 homocysteine S-methyltransferase family protein [Microvirga rosea]
MSSRPSSLPQPDLETVFLTDGGLETSLLFIEGIDLPCFASFPLLRHESGRQVLKRYFEPYLQTASRHGVGFILDTATWRANPDWGRKLGYTSEDLAQVNRQAVAFARELGRSFALEGRSLLIDGAIGPRGDGYRADYRMSAEEAERYHTGQIDALRDAGADMVTAFTINYAEEAIGIARAAAKAAIPVVISFTVETDGKLASGESLQSAIEQSDRETGGIPAYYMINCAHPTHIESMLSAGGSWVQRIRGLRANASSKSHAQLDEAEELDSGDPTELARQYRDLRNMLPRLSVLGGCCGTDHRHIEAICEACLPQA